MNTSKMDKKHASHLTPVPQNMKAYPPLHGPDNSYQQLYKKYQNSAFKQIDAAIKRSSKIAGHAEIQNGII